MDRTDTLLRETLNDLPVAPGGLDQTMRHVRSRRRRRTRVRAAGATVFTAAAAAAIVNGLVGGATLASAKTVQVPGKILDAAGTPGRLWALTCTHRCNNPVHSVGRLVAVDARTGHIQTKTVVRSPQAIVAQDGSLWTADFWDSTVTRFSAQTGRPLATVSLKLPRPVTGDDDRFLPSDLTAGERDVWVSTGRGYVARISTETNQITSIVKTAADATGPIAPAGGSIWVGQGLSLGRIEPSTQTLSQTTINGPGDRRVSIGSLTVANGALWAGGEWATWSRDAAGHPDFTVTDEAVLVEIDPATGKPQSIHSLPQGTTVQSEDAGKLWLANSRTRKVYEFNPRTRRIVAAAHVSGTGAVIPGPGRHVWVARRAHEFALVKLVNKPAR